MQRERKSERKSEVNLERLYGKMGFEIGRRPSTTLTLTDDKKNPLFHFRNSESHFTHTHAHKQARPRKECRPGL